MQHSGLSLHPVPNFLCHQGLEESDVRDKFYHLPRRGMGNKVTPQVFSIEHEYGVRVIMTKILHIGKFFPLAHSSGEWGMV